MLRPDVFSKCCAAIVVALLLSGAVPGVAQTPGKKSSNFDSWDKDKDGQLSRDELPGGARRNFDKVDRDNSGFISREEDRAFRNRGARQQQSTPKLPPEVRVERDIAYVKNGHERHALDLYLPRKGKESRPVVVWIHGGGWRNGSKNNCPAIPLVNRGFVVASINYRLSGHAVFPAQINDCKAAIRWLRANAGKYGIDAGHIGVWGSSAGGHLVALLGTSGDVNDLEGEPDDRANADQSSRVQAVCDWFGPTDLLLMNKQAGELGTIDHDAANSPESLLLGGPLQESEDKAKRAGPITYVTSDDPPFLIVHGDQDTLVHWRQSQILADALRESKCNVTLRIVPGAGHGRFRDPKITEDSFRFFEKTLLTQVP
ncbi:MAG: alpha/beta hydrolase fold domain-containing protein [Fuerstiella sp.]|nr:alpha/beta hydrolase fold domain-containing protein [Fuerstiella sp.]MCP4783697.1 alpha/beta hydrolase fold domain-containing protein [Fuerstiella sp.]MCP4854562.1 alpha/beta hydrolase fold domain-containing protein [Fuerstiella sp.]